MAATRRLQKELGDLRKAASKSFRDIQVSKCSSLLFQAGLSRAKPSGYNEAINAGGRVQPVGVAGLVGPRFCSIQQGSLTTYASALCIADYAL